MKTTEERWCEAEVNRIVGENHPQISRGGNDKAEAYFERAHGCVPSASKVLGTARRHEHGAAVYGWFTEGFDTLESAGGEALLDALAL